MSSLTINTSSGMRALTQLRALSSMVTADNAKSSSVNLFSSAGGYSFNVSTLTASQSGSSSASGSLATGVIALSNLQTVLTGMKSLATSAADSATSTATRTQLQSQYNSMLQQANSLMASISGNGITLASITTPNSTATTAAQMGLSSASWSQASDATASGGSAATALSEVTQTLAKFSTASASSYAVRATTQSAVLASMSSSDGTSADLTTEIASLNGLSGQQATQSIQNYLSSRKSTLITSA